MDAASTPEIEVKEHLNFRTINVGGVYGTPLDMRFEIIIYSEHLDATKALASAQTNIPFKFSRTLECRLVLDPFRAKDIAKWLTAHVIAFEKQYGHILTPEERQQKAASTEAEDKKMTTGVG